MKNLAFKIIIVLALGSITIDSHGQVNLVVNPDFEEFSSCPVLDGEVFKAFGWTDCSASPDYFNSCDSTNNVSVPFNWAGYQPAYNGNAYCGFYTWANCTYIGTPPNYREWIEGNLTSSLVPGVKYFLSFRVSSAINSAADINCLSNNIGANFSTIFIGNPGIANTPNSAKIYDNSIINDSSFWYPVAGEFIADSAYNYIMIGNFFDDTSTDSLLIEGSAYKSSYYYIDAICLSTDSIYASNYVGISNESAEDNLIEILPNPIVDLLSINNKSKDEFDMIICDEIGQIVFINSLASNSKKTFNLENLTSGIYFIYLISQNQSLAKKIIKL